MTDLEINEAISLHCGWHLKEGPKGVWFYYFGSSFPNGATPAYALPQYASDLNDMHEAEMVLGEMFLEYIENLKQITWNSLPHEMSWGDFDGPWDMHAIAVARQRAEAFLRTIGRWKE